MNEEIQNLPKRNSFKSMHKIFDLNHYCSGIKAILDPPNDFPSSVLFATKQVKEPFQRHINVCKIMGKENCIL